MDRIALAMEQMVEFMMAQQAQNQNQGQPRVDFAKAVASRQPPYYAGEKDLVILEEWIRTFDKLLNAVNCPADQRVPSAVYYLTKAADNWWATVRPDLLQDPGFGWEEFKVELRGQFYTERIKGIKCKEFLRLKQKGATVQDYHDKYVELMMFAQEIVPDEASKARRFVRGLDWEVRGAIAPFLCSILKEAYDRASDHYQVYLDQQEVYGRNKRKAYDNQRKFRLENKKSNQGESNPKQGEKRGGTNQGKHSVCWKCGKDHPGVNCQGMKIKCYKCGLTGHKYYECRTKVENFWNHSQNTSPRGGFNGSTGQKPAEARNKGVNFQPVNRGRPANASSGPNHKGNSPMGKATRRTKARFTSSIALKLRLKLRPTIRLDLNVKVASGIVVACKDGYDNVSIEIAGFNYPRDLIRFDLEGIDVVLGMDCLDRHKAQIVCNERKIVLRGPKGKRISYRGIEKPPEPKLMTMQELRKYARKGCEVYLCLVQDAEIGEPEINRIPVVCEFPDVFPDDLTEIPPKREVEFTINLVLGTSPVTPHLFR
ncbi:uncharacterized protein LOC116022468 [Ipomoea triloba]|uniref:uncharacterized protein LOC116022468 n=1 Tax=Ipomoea triloba TaxID=35885 RepID=UPI00125E2834|nr:uncharacterized protein LOC116022468 [Ipomoea triloba]